MALPSTLEEAERTEWGRTFTEIIINGVFGFSVQASDAHACSPEQTLDDPYAYESFEITLRQLDVPFIDTPGKGAWESFESEPWFSKFDRGMVAGLKIYEFAPVAEVQTIYEKLVEYASVR